MSDGHHKHHTSQLSWSKFAPLIDFPHVNKQQVFPLAQAKTLALSFFGFFSAHPIRKPCQPYLQNMSRIWPFLPTSTASTLVQVPNISCLNVWSSPFPGLPASTLTPYRSFSTQHLGWLLFKYNSHLISPLCKALQFSHLTLDECQHLCSGLQGLT